MLIIVYEYINIIQNMTNIENPQMYYDVLCNFSHKFHYAYANIQQVVIMKK